MQGRRVWQESDEDDDLHEHQIQDSWHEREGRRSIGSKNNHNNNLTSTLTREREIGISNGGSARKGVERKYFEDELKALQDDITDLSRKLSLPIHAIEGGNSRNRSRDFLPSSQLHQNGKGKRNGYESDTPTDQLSNFHHSDSDSQPSTHPKGQLNRLKKELHQMTRQRDEALSQIQQLQHENSQLKQSTSDYHHLKSTCEHLLHEIDSLKISLQSSENIRKQQKELLVLLQRSQSMVDSSRHQVIPYLHQQDETLGSVLTAGTTTSSLHDGSGRTRDDVESFHRQLRYPSPPTSIISTPLPSNGLSSPEGDRRLKRSEKNHTLSTPPVTSSVKKMTRKRSPSAGSRSHPSSSKSTPVSGPSTTPRYKSTPNSTPATPSSVIRNSKLTSRSTPSSDSDTSSRYSHSRHQHTSSTYSTGVHSTHSISSRPPLAPHSNTSSHFHHLPNKPSPLGRNKVKSRPQSAPPTPSSAALIGSTSISTSKPTRGSFYHSYHLTPPSSRGGDRR